MAGLFGELVFQNSRAFDECYELEDNGQDKHVGAFYQIDYDSKYGVPTSLDMLIVAHKNLAITFCKQMIPKDSIQLGKIQLMKTGNTAVSKESSPVYLLNEKVAVILCENVEKHLLHDFLKQFSVLMGKASLTVFLTSAHASTYLTQSEADPPYIRHLSSQTFKQNIEKQLSSHLLQPNIIQGIPAAGLSWCEINNKSGLVLCTYCDTDDVDSITLSPLFTLVKKSSVFNRISSIAEKAQQRKTKVVTVDHGNMYI